LKLETQAKQWVIAQRIDVGVHVRRSDMQSYSHTRKYNQTQYILNAMQKMQSLHGPNLRYFVASEDRTWLQSQNIIPNATISPFQAGNFAMDIAVLAACPHVIMTVGTFGWWAAYHTRGTVTYLPEAFQPKYFSGTDYFLPHWIPVTDVQP
jgi:galactoside 2-L-fucosyltransferase 1/2